jgi:hypothetical protein
MPINLKSSLPRIWPLLLLAAADAILLTPTPLWLRFIAALGLLAFLPGWFWLKALAPGPINRVEQVTLAVGLSLALTIIGTMGAVYLPGPLTEAHVLAVINAIALTGGGLALRRGPLPLSPTSRRLLLAAILLLALAAALRLPRLGYAEFHEDEAEALMLGVRLFQGEDYALFLHRKGPAQMLVPVALWLLTGSLTEALARAAFALSSLFSVLTLFLLGRRWFGGPVGLIAALLWVVNGYAIGFGRMVQYQSLIFFMGPLALYALTLAGKLRQPGYQLLAAMLLAASLLAHFDALLLLPAAAYLWAAGFLAIRQESPRRAIFGLSLSLGLFIAILSAFYVPYLRDPEFQHTTAYLTESRVKPGLLYNNLTLLRRLDRDYSSHFYLPLLALGLVSLILAQSTPWPGRAGRFFSHPLLRVGLLALAATTIWFPAAWQVGPANLAVLPWLALLALCFLLAPTAETRAAWLMFGAPFIGYVFLVDDPRTHVYIMYPGAVLLAGAGLDHLRLWIGDLRLLRPPRLTAQVLGLLFAAALGMIAVYEAAIFLPTESEWTARRANWQNSAWGWVYAALPKPREYFGYPKREGWKAIGALRAEGRFPGDFRSVNEDFIIPIWYNYGEARSCYDTPAQLLVRLDGLTEDANKTGYRPTGQIEREDEARLEILSAAGTGDDPARTFALEDYVDAFDRQATPQQFARQNEPSQPYSVRFGEVIEFTGLDLPATVVSPGETLAVDLHWQAITAPPTDYRAFVHLTDGTRLWAQQDDNPACRLPTSIWRAGQRSLGQFRLHLAPDTPPGRYPLLIGLYRADTLERLPITGGSAGQPGDDFLWLGDIEVTP